MSRSTLRTMVAAFVAVLAFSAVAAASASAALPEFTGSFPDRLILTDTHEVVFENEYGESVECLQGLEASGSITGAKTVSAVLTLKGCQYPGAERTKCTSTGLKAGEIRTGELPAVPVYLSKASKEVGLDFNEYTKTKASFAKFTCGEIAEESIRGAVIAAVSPVNTETLSFSLKLKQSGGKQLPTWFENETGGKVTNVLEGTTAGHFSYFPMGFGSGETVSLRTQHAHVLKA